MNNNRITALLDAGHTMFEVMRITGAPYRHVAEVQSDSVQADMTNTQRMAIWRRQREGATRQLRLNRREK